MTNDEMKKALDAVYEANREFGVLMAKSRSGSVGWTAPAPADYSKADISLCIEAVQAYAESLRGGGRANLLLVGPAGRGKSFSGLSVLKSLEGSLSVRFCSETEFMGAMRSAALGGDYEKTMAEFTFPRLLCLDDLGKSKVSEWSAATLFDLINRRRERGRATVYTSQYAAQGLHGKLCGGADREVADAIASRLSMCEVARLEGPDRRRP